MLLFRRNILTTVSMALGILLLLLGAKAAHQEALVLPSSARIVSIAPVHRLALHSHILGKLAHHPAGAIRHKHHRSRAHRITVVKIAVMPIADVHLQMPIKYRELTLLPLSETYRYLCFREIIAPPPKSC